jgi:hypothetical protein
MAKSLADLVELCIERQGAVTGVIPPEQGAKSISDEIAKWRDSIVKAGISKIQRVRGSIARARLDRGRAMMTIIMRQGTC